MIIVIANKEKELDRYGLPTGKMLTVASHGIDIDTGQTIVLEQCHPQQLGAKFDLTIDEWVLQ